MKDAKDILRIEDKGEMETNATRLAFALLARDKDMEKEMALLYRKHLERDSFRMSQLMYVTQRYVIGAYCEIL